MSKKKFSQKIMEFPIKVLVSQGMYKRLVSKKKADGESYSNYIRSLIMNDLKIDYDGKETKTG